MPSTAWSPVRSPAPGDAGLAPGERTRGGTLAYAEFATGQLLLGHLGALWCPHTAVGTVLQQFISPLAEEPAPCQADRQPRRQSRQTSP